MPLVGCESFDWVRTGEAGMADLALKQPPWSAVTTALSRIEAGAGRHGTQALCIIGSNSWLRTYPQLSDRLIFSCSLRIANNYPPQEQQILLWYASGNIFAALTIRPTTGLLRAYTRAPNNSALTLRAESTVGWGIARDHYLEARITGGASGGIVVRRDGETIINWAGNPGADGTPTTTQFDMIQFGGNEVKNGHMISDNPWWIDDVVILAGTAADTDFWGDRHIRCQVPTGQAAGGWSAVGAPSNWEAVDEIPHDGDASYVQTLAASGAQDLYTYPALPGEITDIKAIQVCAIARKTGAGAANIQLLTQSGATTSPGASQTTSTTYVIHTARWETDPATGLAWTRTGVNNARHGIKAP